MSVEKRIYLDHAATTPLNPAVLDTMLPWMGLTLGDGFGNTSSLYREAKRARQALDEARATVAELIGASAPEIIFTSGGTESNNMLIAGITQGVREKQGINKGGNWVITSAFEHHSVLEPVRSLKRYGWQTTELAPNASGVVEANELKATLEQAEPNNKATLISVMTANNEVGTIQPIAELARVAHEHGALFHTDAVQALGKTPFDVRLLGIDAASFSAHKFEGPKGIGAVYLRSLTPFRAQQLGGGQELDLRSGTVNVAGAIGFAHALDLSYRNMTEERNRLTELRDQLAHELCGISPKISLVVDPEVTASLPHILSILVEGFESQSLILALDEKGFAVSSGAACSTGSLEPSHVLLSMGISKTKAQTALRISLGTITNASDIIAFLQAFAAIVRQ